jgi:TRAP-type C4-dicarboxylate transport system permease small subunit
MSRLRKAVDKSLAWLLIALMFAAVINVLWQVFTRWVLDAPSPYTEELARYLLIWIGLIGAGYAAGQKIHLAIDLLPSMLKGRRRLALEIVIDGFILLFAVFVLIAGGYRLVSLTLLMGQRSAALGVQLGYVYTAIPLSGLIIAFYAILSIRERVAALRGGEIDLVEPDRSTQKPID